MGIMIFYMGLFLAGVLATPGSSELADLAKANNDFALKLHKTLPSTGNIFHSPASVSIALGMLFKGAGGSTAQEMRRVLGYESAGLRDSSVHEKFKELLELFENSSDEYKLQIANAIVSSSNYPILGEYKEALKYYYGAIAKEVDFSKKKRALEEINSWVSEKTQGKIPKLLDDLDDSTVLVLLNAVYFKGTWKRQFNASDTREEVFYVNGIDSKPVPMMKAVDYFFYSEFAQHNLQALKLSYKGEDVSMVILLPSERRGLKKVEEFLTVENFDEIMSDLQERKVKVTFPKFKLEYSRKLNDDLKLLGMQEAFQKGAADFSGIDRSRRMFVSDVIHKAVVEVNEEGSEAAAATAVIAVTRSGFRRLPEFKADRPFLFLIRDERSGMILFVGRVNTL